MVLKPIEKEEVGCTFQKKYSEKTFKNIYGFLLQTFLTWSRSPTFESLSSRYRVPFPGKGRTLSSSEISGL